MPRPDPVARALVEAALQLHRRKPWLEVERDAPFLVRVEGEELPLVAVVIGHLGQDYGVFFERGEGAFARLAGRILAADEDFTRLEHSDMLAVNIERRSELHPPFDQLLAEAGLQFRRDALAPFVFVKPAGRVPRPPNRGERRLLALAMRGIDAALAAGELRPTRPDPRRKKLLELEVTGSPRRVEHRVRQVPWPEEPGRAELPALIALPDSLRALPRRAGGLLLTRVAFPGTIEGEERSPQVLFALDPTSERALDVQMAFAGDHAAVVAWLVGLLEGRVAGVPAGLPAEIAFADEGLHDSLAPALAALGVKTHLSARDLGLAGLMEGFAEHMADAEPPPPSADPQTIAEWKAAEREALELLLEQLDRDVYNAPRTLARYFGSAEEGLEALRELEPLGAWIAYADWLLVDHRPTRRSRTKLERLLERKRLTPAQRHLLEARATGELSIYRVVSTEPGDSLELECLFTGRRTTVHDRGLSSSDVLGRFLPLRLARVQGWTFPSIAGPPLGVFQVDAALQLLEELGVELTPEGLRRDAALLGRLWPLALRSRRAAPTLTNTDGDPYEPLLCCFRVEDAEHLARALARRKDVERDEREGDWSWFRPEPAHGAEARTRLARMELHGDELLVELNSRRRLEALRRRLERVRGVRFESARADEARALDDRLPAPPPAALDEPMLAELRRIQEAQSLAWLDLQIPALDGRTPREACRTAEGRRRVAAMIRSMPAMQVPGGAIEPPRERMLRELGLE